MRSRIDRVIDELRAQPGMERFGLPPTVADIAAALAPTTAVAFLSCTETARWLVVIPDGTVDAIELDVAEDHLVSHVRQCHAIALGPAAVNRLEDAPDLPVSDDTFPDWFQRRIGRMAADLGARVVRPLVEYLPDHIDDVVLVPTGYLALLPLHAALDANGSPFALRLGLRYSPTASVLVDRPHGPSPARGGYVVLADSPDLACLAAEAQAIAGLRGHQVVSASQVADREILGAFGDAADAHACGHGKAAGTTSWFQLDSRPEPEPARRFTVSEAYDLPRTDRSEIFLAACSARTPSIALPDELEGFPAAFLNFGHHHVISAGWPISDVAAYTFALRYHLQRAVHPEVPAHQVHADAMRWMWQATAMDCRDLHHEVIARLEAEGRPTDVVRRMGALLWSAEPSTSTDGEPPSFGPSPADRPWFDHPVYWAALPYTGR